MQITFRCEECGTYRFDIVSRLTGDLLYRQYEYPEDYSHEKQSKSNWRAAWMDEIDNNLMEDLSKPAPEEEQ